MCQLPGFFGCRRPHPANHMTRNGMTAFRFDFPRNLATSPSIRRRHSIAVSVEHIVPEKSRPTVLLAWEALTGWSKDWITIRETNKQHHGRPHPPLRLGHEADHQGPSKPDGVLLDQVISSCSDCCSTRTEEGGHRVFADCPFPRFEQEGDLEAAAT